MEITCPLRILHIYMGKTCFIVLLDKFITWQLHGHYIHYIYYICYMVKHILCFSSQNDLFCDVWAGNLFNVQEDVHGRPSTWFVACLLPNLGADSKWDERGGNSKSVRSTELMMECNDCLFEGWNVKPEGDKMLGDRAP